MFNKVFQRALRFRLKKSYPTNIYDLNRGSTIAVQRPYSDEVRKAQAQSIAAPGPTIFDKIISKEIKADIIYEDEMCLAFNDVSPQAPVHFLVIPKRRIARLQDCEDSDQEDIPLKLRSASRVLENTCHKDVEMPGQQCHHVVIIYWISKILGHLMLVARSLGSQRAPSGWRLIVNNGRDGAQSVYHLHIHVLGGRQMGWPPG